MHSGTGDGRSGSTLTVDDRLAAGRSLRQQVPRSSHGVWEPADDRVDPLAMLQAEEKDRLPELVPVRYGRMLASPFTFYRATAALMASDLATTPVSGLTVQASGDAHLSNFGAFATPERTLVFDLNDFDETLPGPWEWDVKRLAASVVLAGRANGFRASDCAIAARAAVRSYRERMAEFAPMSHLAVWYSQITAAAVAAALPKSARKHWERGATKATRRDHLHSLEKMTTLVDGKLRITDDPPLIVHHSDEVVGDRVPAMADSYRSTLRDDVSALLQRYTFVDFAQKTVGVGSVGTRCYVVLMRGNDDDDPLFLQIKEASASELEPYLGKSQYRNHGQRVVRGQQATQAASDIFLGWGRGANGVDFYVRQLRDMKGSVDLTQQSPERMALYAELCGRVLARAHARTGDAAMISGYMGDGDAFDTAIVGFARAYADQAERDHAALVAAVKSGKVAAEVGR
jgi:uncharacterized protein (DUF2252 family)